MEAAPQSPGKLYLIVPCRGRLEFIKQTIAAALAQPNADYIFVDYSCPQQSGEWVRAHYPRATVVSVEGRHSWHASEARNLGAKEAGDGWLCFVDSDIILHPDFAETVRRLIKPGVYLAASRKPGIYGLTVCAKEDFERIGGYDEILRQYRGEDVELRVSLNRTGLSAVELPESVVTHIDHGDELRAGDNNVKEEMATDNINMLYVYVKDYLIRNGGPRDPETLQELVKYCQDRFFAGFPWLSWPDPDKPFCAPDAALEFADSYYGAYSYLFRTFAAIAKGYRSVYADSFGGVRAFRIARTGQPPLLELLTAYKSQTVTVRAVSGQPCITVMNLIGEVSSIPLEDGKAAIALSCEPIFLLEEDTELVRDLQITVAPSAGPALAVELVPAPGYVGNADVAVAVGGHAPVSRTILLEGAPVRMTIPVAVDAPEKPEDVAVAVNFGGLTREVVRRTTFLTAARVTGDEAASVIPPDRVTLFQVGTPESWRDMNPDSGTPPDGWRADIAWGWTGTDLICWISRHADSPNANCDGVVIAVDARNHKALFAPGYEFTLRWKDGHGWVELQKFPFGATTDLPELLTRGESGQNGRFVIRLPFAILGIAPQSGQSIGVSLLFPGGEGLTGWLEWGGGIAPGKNGRSYNEITLE